MSASFLGGNTSSSTRAVPRVPSNANVVSNADLEQRNHLSSIQSPSPLETFYATPVAEKPVAFTALHFTKPSSPRTEPTFAVCCKPSLTSPQAYGIPDVDDLAIHPAQNTPDHKDVRAADRRGSRRGRKRRWQHHATGLTTPQATYDNIPTERFPPLAIAIDRQTKQELVPVEMPFYCTWPSCSVRFQNRSNWVRHEEALHYCPYNWICYHKDERPCLVCHDINHGTLHHFAKCALNDLESRTFLREDQLTQHIKRAHINLKNPDLKISKQLLRSWQIINPFFSEEHLLCGFCGIVCETWVQRKDHVWDHLKTGVCKSAWWPQRLAQPSSVYYM